MKTKPQVNRVVVRVPNWVGDAVMCVPALRELRRLLPDAHITIASRPGTADVFTESDIADDVLIYERAGLSAMWKQAAEWKRRKFDLAILFQNAFEAAAVAFLARVPARIGYATEYRSLLVTQPIPSPAWKNTRHEVFYYTNIVGELERKLFGTDTVEASTPQTALRISEDRKRKAHELLRAAGLDAASSLVLLCPGSVNSRAKRWPAERYAALSDQFSEAGAAVILIGSPGEITVSEEVARLTRHRPFVLTGKTSVAEVIALIAIADVLITNDTGPAHIGPAVGTPALVIFGPTNPLTTRPFGETGEIIRNQPDCAPCMLRDCPIDHRCMTAIAPDQVFAQARRMMRRPLEVIA